MGMGPQDHPESGSVEPVSTPIDISPLPRYLDIANAANPIGLASSLSHECVGKIPMLHILRLMFLLKPSDDDWSIDGYPARYADIPELPQLETDGMNDEAAVNPKQRWLEEIINELRFPVHDEETTETISLLSEPLAAALNTPNVIKSAWLTHVLCNINKHPPKVARIVLERVDFIKLIRGDLKRDGDLVEKLIICAANPSLCDHLRKPSILDAIISMKEDKSLNAGFLLDSLVGRIQGWIMLKEALETEDTDFASLIPWICDMLGDEESFAMFIQGLAAYEPIWSLLKTAPASGKVYPLLSESATRASLVDRKAFMRGLVGLGCVLPIFCWANSEGNHRTLQRVIHAFSIWQDHPGYSDILNRMLSLKQCIWRLSMTVKDYTQGTSIEAERLLYGLYRSNPTVFFKPAFMEYLSTRSNSWLPIFSDTRYPKGVGEPQSGLELALRTLLSPAFIPSDTQDDTAAYLLRVTTEFLCQTLQGGNLDRVFQTLLDLKAETSGIATSLIEHFSSIVELLSTTTFSRLFFQRKLMQDLLNASKSLLHLFTQLGVIFPPLPRVVDKLSRSMILLLVVSNRLQSMAPTIDPSIAALAQNVEQAHIEVVKAFSRDRFGSVASYRLLDSLLLQSQYSLEGDLALEIRVVGIIFDTLLPDPASNGINEHSRLWVSRIVERMPGFQQFLRRNPPIGRVKWITRLARMDEGEFDLAASLISNELTLLNLLLKAMQDREPNSPLDYALQFQVSTILEEVKLLLEQSRELMGTIILSGTCLEQIIAALVKMSNLRIFNESCVPLALELVQSKKNANRLLAACILLRQYRTRDDICLPNIMDILKGRSGLNRGEMDNLIAEMGSTLRSASGRQSISQEDAHVIIEWLEWLSSTKKNIFIPTLTYDAFQTLRTIVEKVLDVPNSNLEAIGTELLFADDELMDDGVDGITLIMQLAMSPNQISSLLTMQDQPRTPPRLVTHPALGLVTTSPPSINRSPISATLNKTYLNNDFRQLRATGVHTNTTRPPSVHVDEFVTAGSPLGSQSVTSQVSTQNSPAMPQVTFNSFIPGL
ncbi:hypothetical protein FRC17_009622 [Serendipita sp. 399]|nr:hypothetical protein FRC17_009622 [Serendipita sp. 399]